MTTTEKKPAAFKLMERADLLKEIARIKTAGAKLDARIQTAAVHAAIHSHTHNEISLCVALLDTMPKGMRGNALKDWMVTYAPVAFVKGQPEFSRVYDGKDEEARAAAVEHCQTATEWVDFKPESAFVPFNFTQKFAALIKSAEAALKDTEHAGEHKVTAAQIAALKALAV